MSEESLDPFCVNAKMQRLLSALDTCAQIERIEIVSSCLDEIEVLFYEGTPTALLLEVEKAISHSFQLEVRS